MKLLILVLSLFSSVVFAQTTNYEHWLRNEGYYLLSAQQKEEFRAMTNDQKEQYIRNLWLSLDPEPVTAENEFQIEYMKRFEHAKKRYGIPSDRAKIYLLLGKPNSVEDHHSSDKYYPLELWSYYSLGMPGLPPSLDLIFFKRWGTGDFRLYSPGFDGFQALTPMQLNLAPGSTRLSSRVRSAFDPTVLKAAEGYTVGSSSANESEVVRALLQDPNAMQRLVKKRPFVETTAVYEAFQADVTTYSVPFRDDVLRTSVALAVPPKYLTFEKDGAVYQSRVDVIGRVVDEKGNTIIEINDSPAVKLQQEQFQKARQYLFSYVFDAYLLPGKYTLSCSFRDYVSNVAGRIEESFQVAEPPKELDLLPPMLAFQVVRTTANQSAFGYNFRQYYPKENSSFNKAQTAIFYTSIINPGKLQLSGIWQLRLEVKNNDRSVIDVKEDLPLSTDASEFPIVRKLPLESLEPGQYVMKLSLENTDHSIFSEAPLIVTTDAQVLGRLRYSHKGEPPPQEYHANIAKQYFLRNNMEQAARHARIALDFAPTLAPVRRLAAQIEEKKGNKDEAIAMIETLLSELGGDTESYFLAGKWYFEKQDWKNAAQLMEKAMSSGYYTVELLNLLAASQLRLGNEAQAVTYWEKSLALNANQPEVEKQLRTYKR